MIGGGVVPAIVLGVLFAMVVVPMRVDSHGMPPSALPEVRVTGHRWWFEATYLGASPEHAVRVPTEIHVPVGRPVELEVASVDVVHSFWVPRLAGRIDLIPGRRDRVRFVASEPGVYHGECAEFCSLQHAHMRIEVVAELPEIYDAWLEQQRAPAETDIHDPEASRGARVFAENACPLCHTVRGTAALGTVGPDLTHVGSRRRIAGGMLDNDTANLAAWVVNAQALKPGAQMPAIRSLPGADLRALVAYLQSLR